MGIQTITISILALTVGLSLGRPKIGVLRFDHVSAGIIGAMLCIATGIVPLETAVDSLQFLFSPIITIISLMTITVVAEASGLFNFLAKKIAIGAKGNANRLFFYIFLMGTLSGTIFTNDAAVLIFTPLVFKLIEDVQEESWTLANKFPFYFAVLYVANVAGALIISNPINIVASQFFNIGFIDYASWMLIPALISIIVSYIGIRIFFRRELPTTYRLPEPTPTTRKQYIAMIICGIVLILTLMAFFSEPITHLPTWKVAFFSAATLLLLHGKINDTSYSRIFKGIGWDVIIFVIGIFLIANSIRSSGLTLLLGGWLQNLAANGLPMLSQSIGLLSAGLSAVINNHPTAYIMPMVIQDIGLSDFASKIMLFSALIGGDLGPKMLPIGSLAALMWFRILRNKGVEVPYKLYVKIGIPVSLTAVILSILVLNLEVYIYSLFN